MSPFYSTRLSNYAYFIELNCILLKFQEQSSSDWAKWNENDAFNKTRKASAHPEKMSGFLGTMEKYRESGLKLSLSLWGKSIISEGGNE